MHDLSEAALEAAFIISQRMAQPGITNDIIKDILTVLDQVMGYRHGIVTLLEKDSGDLLVEAVHGCCLPHYTSQSSLIIPAHTH